MVISAKGILLLIRNCLKIVANESRWYTTEEKFNGAANAKTMAQNMGKHSGRPDLVTEIEKFVFEKDL